MHTKKNTDASLKIQTIMLDFITSYMYAENISTTFVQSMVWPLMSSCALTMLQCLCVIITDTHYSKNANFLINLCATNSSPHMIPDINLIIRYVSEGTGKVGHIHTQTQTNTHREVQQNIVGIPKQRGLWGHPRLGLPPFRFQFKQDLRNTFPRRKSQQLSVDRPAYPYIMHP